jgi:two-component system response regulator AtoC
MFPNDILPLRTSPTLLSSPRMALDAGTPYGDAVPTSGHLSLVAVSGEHTHTWPLPERGELRIGSAPSCECQIPHASVAPQHAVLHLGPTLEIEDLHTSQGTRLRGVPVPGGRRERIAPGDALMLGDVIVIIQNPVGKMQRRIWTHGYFESRVEEECTRAERNASSFAVVRIHCPSGVPLDQVEECLADVLRLVDVVGAYGPGEYEAILLDTKQEGARVAAQRLSERLAALSPEASVGLACFPHDGRDAATLMAQASGRSRGEDQLTAEPLSSTEGIRRVYELAARIASTDINVLILGETGVGKEKLAELIHQKSNRATKPFVGLNVTALTESLLESELFGHERGAFTGAVQAKPGLLETADGGSVLLDEVGEMPPATQAKLLRVLETRQVLRVGGVKPRAIDVRFIAATNQDLEAQIRTGAFREDLYYRLNGISFVLPPLRERVDEIEDLAKLFVGEYANKYARSARVLSNEALRLMQRYAWPGNIRELRNVVERAVVVCTGSEIGLEHLPVEKMSATFAARSVRARPTPTARQSLAGESPPPPERIPQLAAKELRHEIKELERTRIIDALATCGGNQTAAASLLGISRRTLINRIGSYGIPRPRTRARTPKAS